MSCTNCQNNNQISYSYTTPPKCPHCTNTCTCSSCGGDSSCRNDSENKDSSDIIYSGHNLLCSGVESGATVEEIIQKFDEKFCSLGGSDYSTYTIASCLLTPSGGQITSEKEFVESISDYVCNFKSEYNTFITEYNTFVTEVTEVIQGVNSVGATTCVDIGIVPTDTIAEGFTKMGNSVCGLIQQAKLTGVNWNVCGFSTSIVPSTIPAGFTKILEYFCQLSNSIPSEVTLPTFNNVGSCLPGVNTAADSIGTTIEKLKSKVCSLDYDLTGLNFGCVPVAGNLQGVLQNIIDRVNANPITYFHPTDFIIETMDGGPCFGRNIKINAANFDRKVASNSSDTTPGTLFDKLQAGTNVTLDFLSVPGKVIINSTGGGGGSDNFKVRVNASDPDGSGDYLDTKIDGGADLSGAMTITASANGTNDKVIVTPNINYNTLTQFILNEINTNSTLKAIFASIVCDSDCGRTVGLKIFNEPATAYAITLQQNTPPLTWYSSGVVSSPIMNTNITGVFTITDPSASPVATLTIINHDTLPCTYTISMKNTAGVAIPGGTSTVITLPPGGTYSNGSFNLGTGGTDHVVNISILH